MRRWLLTAALVCALASGGCASKYTGQENGKAEEQSNQAFAERSQNETAAGQTEAGLPEKDRQEESAETAGETADETERDATGRSETAGDRITGYGMDGVGETDGL